MRITCYPYIIDREEWYSTQDDIFLKMSHCAHTYRFCLGHRVFHIAQFLVYTIIS